MEKNKEKNKKTKKDSKAKWIIEVFILTFVLSYMFSYIAENGIDRLNIVFSIIVLILVILIGVIFDLVGTAVMIADEQVFHAKATKKAKGSKNSIMLIKNAPKVASFCADIIGDICGVLSGSICTLISAKMYSMYGVSVSVLVTAIVSSITVGTKAIGKEFANSNSTKIVHVVGVILAKFKNEKGN